MPPGDEGAVDGEYLQNKANPSWGGLAIQTVTKIW